MKKGFTIIELLTVIGILAVLITIVIVAAGGAIKNARSQRAEAMRLALEQAIEAYHAQDPDGRWPDMIESHADDDEDLVTFTGTDADKIFQEVVGKGFGKSGTKSILIDASALFVANASRANDERAVGFDFPQAANRNSKDCIPFNNMAFGYPESEHGRFRRFKVVYNMKTDSVTVKK